MEESDTQDDLQTETESVLMQATFETIAADGYDGLSLRTVAERAGKSRGLLHYYFDSKDDLVHSLLAYLLDQIETELRTNTEGSAEEQLRSVLERIAKGPTETREQSETYFKAILALRARAPYDEHIRQQLTHNHQAFVDRCASIIAEGIQAGEFIEVDSETTANVLVSAVDGARNTDLTTESETACETMLEFIDQFITGTLLMSDK
ncbi:transcriptional regulator [Haloferax larsenii JCM 13917]|nr:TetR/AcrR family transcriptional regulator [Haloferax larsenii]ELZ78178.1 transcriptional regulator [Haloferax larsenii JCM 13917]